MVVLMDILLMAVDLVFLIEHKILLDFLDYQILQTTSSMRLVEIRSLFTFRPGAFWYCVRGLSSMNILAGIFHHAALR